jgi:predicted PurR-regulated permease PerM
MTNEPAMQTALDVAQKLAERNDRFAFFAALIVLIISGVWVVRYLVTQNQTLVQQLTASHTAFQGELKVIVKENHSVMTANTEATVKQNELLRRIEEREFRKANA